jgi:hypothetical protein
MAVPFKLVDGVSIPLTADEIAEHQAARAAAAANAPAVAQAAFIAMILPVIAQTDKTMLRIAEAVALGLNSWTSPDVVAWVNYRRALRALIRTGSGESITQPPYPAGT